MAFDTFLKIDGVPGESTDDKHKDWIEILSYSSGISLHTTGAQSSSGAAAAQRADFQDFTVVKPLDKCSPKLALACASGKPIKEVILELCRAGGDKFKYMEYKMSNCVVTSCRPGGSSKGSDTVPLEEVTFNFAKIEWTYTQMKRADGSGGGNVAANWDLTKNKGA
jgi:type VI secretion system secreted protein Hcp